MWRWYFKCHSTDTNTGSSKFQGENLFVAAVAREKMVTLKDVAVVPGDLTEEAMDTS